MLKKVSIAVLFALVVGVLALPVRSDGPNGPSGESNIGHVYLYEKDPVTWQDIEGGAWGKMKYILSGESFVFVFNGHGLEPGTEYTLIYYPDPWPGNDLICLDTATADESGNVHIKGAKDTGTDLPADCDTNAGAKFWLVLSSDVECTPPTKMITFQPTRYLFEAALISFNYEELEYLLQ